MHSDCARCMPRKRDMQEQHLTANHLDCCRRCRLGLDLGLRLRRTQAPSSPPSAADTLTWQCFNAAVGHGELAALNAQPAKKTHIGDVHWRRTAPDRDEKGLLHHVRTYRCSSLADNPHLHSGHTVGLWHRGLESINP